MDNFLSYFNQIQETQDRIQREKDKALQHLFSGQIKGNFLISTKYKVLKKIGGEIPKYFDMRLTSEKMVSATDEAVEYEICRMIVGIHRSNLVFTSEDERLKKERSAEYQGRLVDDVVEHVKLRQYSSALFRKQPIICGDHFAYFPVPYDLFAISTRLNLMLATKEAAGVPCYQSIVLIVNKGLAALSLLEDNFLDNAYPICRGIIELYLKMLLQLSRPDAIEAYKLFSGWELDKSCCSQEYPDDFLDAFANRICTSERDKVHYLHFGWVDDIDDYHRVVQEHPYSMKGIIEYLHFIFDQENPTLFDDLEVLYKMCHGYTHGNIGYSKYPLLHYFEISMMLYNTMLHTYRILCEALNSDGKINGIDIDAKLEKDMAVLADQYERRSTENFERYYKK